MLTRPGVVRAAPALPGISRVGLPSASPSLLRQARRRRSLTSAQIISASWRTGVQIQTDDITDFVDELRIVGQLEGVELMRLEPERFPDPADRRLGQSGLGGHRGSRPMRGIFGGTLQRGHYHRLDLLVGDAARSSRARLIDQAVEPT